MFVLFSVLYILIAAAMIVLILLQRGAGADAGSGFGGGASGTVFGARGSASFLTRATAVLAALFFLLSLGMGMYLSHNGAPQANAPDLGVMSGATTKAATARVVPPVAAGDSDVPQATLPAAPAKPAATPASEREGVPATPQPAKH